MSSSHDRLSQGYEPDFDIDYEAGRQGELFVADVIESIRNGEALEIKTDFQVAATGKVYLETLCLTRHGWEPSGIDRPGLPLLCSIVLAGVCAFVAPTEALRAAARTYGQPGSCKRGNHPTKGLLVPVGQLTASVLHEALRGSR